MRRPSNANRCMIVEDRTTFPPFFHLPSLPTTMSLSTSSISSKSTLSNNADDKHPNEKEIKVNSVHSSSARFVWPKIKRTDIVIQGESIPGYRFIQDDNQVG
jgi:hypothetical protein